MNCHSQIWSDSPKLAPVRESFRTGEPLKWTRVTDLPDFVHFHHGVHVQKGVRCATCHGPIEQMPLTRRTATLHMMWCLDCHRTTEEHVGPRSDVFRTVGDPVSDEESRKYAAEYRVRKPTDCSACHF
jgi:hypothetical protein